MSVYNRSNYNKILNMLKDKGIKKFSSRQLEYEYDIKLPQGLLQYAHANGLIERSGYADKYKTAKIWILK